MRRLFPIGVCVVLTLAAAAAGRSETLRFSVTADMRDGARFPALLEAMAALPGGPGAFMVSPGDIDPPAGVRADLDAAFGPHFPWYPIVGNHEAETPDHMAYLRTYYDAHLDGDDPRYVKVNPGPPGCAETTWSMDVGPVHIVALNEYWDGGSGPGSDAALDGRVVSGLRDWLAADLAASDKRWKLVFGHEPAWPQPDADWGRPRHVGDSLDKYPDDRDAFWEVLEAGGAAAYLCGHTHKCSAFRPGDGSVWQIDVGEADGHPPGPER